MSLPRKTADQWFAEYGESHKDDTNELIHWICVPSIFLSVMGFIRSIPVPAAVPGWFTWDIPVALAVLVLREHIHRIQIWGLLAAVCSVLLVHASA